MPFVDAHPGPGAQHATRTVAVFAPGGYDADPARLGRALDYLNGRGIRTVTALEPQDRHGRFSGTDAERQRWIEVVTDDPTIDVAIALRGGYGATRLLPSIDFTAMARAVRNDGKRWVGHSDFTAIGLGLLATTGAISFAGPMASYDFGGFAIDPFTEQQFWRAMDEARVDVAFDTMESGTRAVEGLLWGGNLSMLCSLVGTPWMPAVDRGILFIEDINEQPYRIERMLFQLQQAGLLERQSLILCGDFSGHRVADYDRDYGLIDALDRIRAATPVPIVTGLPFGHCPRKLTLAVGARARVEVARGRCRLTQAWDLRAC